MTDEQIMTVFAPRTTAVFESWERVPEAWRGVVRASGIGLNFTAGHVRRLLAGKEVSTTTSVDDVRHAFRMPIETDDAVGWVFDEATLTWHGRGHHGDLTCSVEYARMITSEVRWTSASTREYRDHDKLVAFGADVRDADEFLGRWQPRETSSFRGWTRRAVGWRGEYLDPERGGWRPSGLDADDVLTMLKNSENPWRSYGWSDEQIHELRRAFGMPNDTDELAGWRFDETADIWFVTHVTDGREMVFLAGEVADVVAGKDTGLNSLRRALGRHPLPNRAPAPPRAPVGEMGTIWPRPGSLCGAPEPPRGSVLDPWSGLHPPGSLVFKAIVAGLRAISDQESHVRSPDLDGSPDAMANRWITKTEFVEWPIPPVPEPAARLRLGETCPTCGGTWRRVQLLVSVTECCDCP